MQPAGSALCGFSERCAPSAVHGILNALDAAKFGWYLTAAATAFAFCASSSYEMYVRQERLTRRRPMEAIRKLWPPVRAEGLLWAAVSFGCDTCLGPFLREATSLFQWVWKLPFGALSASFCAQNKMGYEQ